MKISTNSRYALRFLVRVAQREGERTTTAFIAELEGISEKLLERIAAKLAAEGFVQSVKGAKGGYILSRPASEITVSEILKTMERPYLPHHCIEDPENCCKMYEGCGLLCLWQKIDNTILSVTDNVTVADLAKQRINCHDM